MFPMIQSFRFAVLNDLHYTDPEDRPWLEGIINQVNQTGAGGGDKIELCLILGDLAELGTEEELAAAKQILSQLKMPWHVVPGNHDGPPGRDPGAPGDGSANLTAYEKFFPNQRNYMFEHKGWQFVALDTTDGSGWQNVTARPETLAFAKSAASKLDKNRPTIIFTHFPIGTGVPYTITNGPELLALFRGQKIPVIFSGHYHGQTSVTQGGIELITNRCCSMRREIHDGQTSRGYFLCRTTPDAKVEREFIEFKGPKSA
jgi:3',5'-cyclic AMP phosphodiesterase CpdA